MGVFGAGKFLRSGDAARLRHPPAPPSRGDSDVPALPGVNRGAEITVFFFTCLCVIDINQKVCKAGSYIPGANKPVS
ncbi:MAG: hypothetical protein BWK80_03235 [Desulfobacteraceae bacterium IS3]|nr:MAG: hypothetical protein BWK80_03235 [Desulfobacteraceae bacterium IS3]